MATNKDVVLIYLEDSPVSFARVESILPDPKKDWYQIKLLMLQIPLQVVTWILKEEYINGDEFHMNGKKMKIETVECPVEELPMEVPGEKSQPQAIPETQEKKENPNVKSDTQTDAQIISFSDLKNRQKDHGPDPE
ncbi:MAG: hypothetical protein GY860_04400 [Desulfobacteraceae bacterium]|nr:hypothetical protein [Desulfobacteraceae bacterium]